MIVPPFFYQYLSSVYPEFSAGNNPFCPSQYLQNYTNTQLNLRLLNTNHTKSLLRKAAAQSRGKIILARQYLPIWRFGIFNPTKRWLTTQMAFHGFFRRRRGSSATESPANSKKIYDDAHKDEIKRKLSIRPFHELIAEMTPEMVKIDPQFVTVLSRMVSRVRRDTRYTKDKRSTGRACGCSSAGTTGTRIRSRILLRSASRILGLRLLGRVGAEAKWKRCAK